MNLIKTQDYLNSEIVESKKGLETFEIVVTPEFEIDGELLRLIVDGHHTYAAALELGVEVELIESDDFDGIEQLESGDVDGFLEIAQVDSYRYTHNDSFVF